MGDNYILPDQPADAIDAAAAQRQGLMQMDMLQAIKHWSKDNIAEKLKESNVPNFNWAFGDQELILSYIDIKRDRFRLSLHTAIIENDFLSSLPEESLNPQLMLQLSNIRARILAVRAPRAHDGYERRLQATNIMNIERTMKVIKPQSTLSRAVGKLMGKPKTEPPRN